MIDSLFLRTYAMLKNIKTSLFINIIYFMVMMTNPSFSQKATSSNDWMTLETGKKSPIPESWIDNKTGNRIVKLTDKRGDNRSFYFHNNPFIPAKSGSGDLMVFYGSTDNGHQLFTVNLSTKETIRITNHTNPIFGEIVDAKRRKVYFQSLDSVYSVSIDNQKTQLEFVFPENFKASITTLNADGTKLAGVYSGKEKRELLRKYPTKSQFFERIFEAKLPHTLFTITLETDQLDKIHTENTWLGHVQFSPKDPDLLMFCHEGPWHKVDRIWTIDIPTGETQLMHHRTMDMEIAGHEFFSRDGKTIWFDLQQPRGKSFYLAGTNVEDGTTKKYTIKRKEWSIHYNISPGQQLFCGDGGDPSQVANAKDGMWIYLFIPKGNQLQSHKLVNMKNHNYDLEPNVHFSPDGKWVIFRADFDGKSNIYGVVLP